MDIARSLKDAESALRDFIERLLVKQYGEQWMKQSGLKREQLERWEENRRESESMESPSLSKESLIQFATIDELYDLLEKNWEGDFQAAFSDLETMKTYLKLIKNFRDPDLHRRELFIYQKHLLLGIAGEIRTRIAAFRSVLELGKDGFPRIEYIKDNYGNVWTPVKPNKLKTGLSLRAGDTLEFVVQATDPHDAPIEFRLHGQKWQNGNIMLLEITEGNIQRELNVHIMIRSTRKHHAYPLGYDDRVSFQYQVLPKDE